MEIEQKFNYDKGGPSNRGVDEYKGYLGFDIEKIVQEIQKRGGEASDIKILDIGAGGGAFQNEAKKRYGVNVVSIDPAYDFNNPKRPRKMIDPENRVSHYDSDEYIKNRKSQQSGWILGKLAAINEALPFKVDTFDSVLASSSSFYYLPDNYPMERKMIEMAFLMLEEIYNVLKPGGEARVQVKKRNDTFENTIPEKFNKTHPGADCKFDIMHDCIIFNKPL